MAVGRPIAVSDGSIWAIWASESFTITGLTGKDSEGAAPSPGSCSGSGACFIALAGIELDQAAVRDLDTLDQPPPRRILAVLHNRVARWCQKFDFSNKFKRVAY